MGKAKVLIDTCVLIDLASPSLPEDLEIFLLERIKNLEAHSELCFSGISLYESLRNAKNELKKNLKNNIFSQFPIIESSVEVLDFATTLEFFYKENETVKSHCSSISQGDFIISATAILNSAYIFTRDRNDFPAPFFLEYKTKDCIFFDKKKRKKLYSYFILKPNMELITEFLK